MDKSSVAEIEMQSISEFQRSLHMPSSVDEDVPSRFSHRYRKTSLSASRISKVPCTSTSQGTVYTFSNKADFLVNVYMTVKPPALRVAPRYQKTIKICWTPNLFHNIIKSGALCFDDDPAQYQDSHWLDIYSQTLMKVDYSKREAYSNSIGNKPQLQEWATFLPPDELILFPPWYFTNSTVLAVPLFNCEMSPVTAKYVFRRRLSELVRMMAMNREGKWVPIKYNHKYIQGVSDKDVIPVPTMYARYATISDSERNWRIGEVHRILIDDVVRVNVKDVYGFGSPVTIGLKCPDITKRIHWVAENMQSSKFNYRSNYTTNPYDLTKGYNPTNKRDLSYGTMNRDPKMSKIHFDTADPFMNMPVSPTVAGYNSASFCYDHNSLNADNGVVTDKLDPVMTIWIKDTDPYLNKYIRSKVDTKEETGMAYADETTEEKTKNLGDPNAKFSIRCYLAVVREIKFEHGKKVEITSKAKVTKM